MRKKLVFGGPRLKNPQYTWFYSALTRGMLHGHPGDEALCVTAKEAAGLTEAAYTGIPRNTQHWTAEHDERFTGFAGVKLILDTEAEGYVKRGQAKFQKCKDDPGAWLGIDTKKTAGVTSAAAGEE